MERRFRTISRIASVSVALMGLLVVIGWLFDVPTFRSVRPGLMSMAFNTAVAFMLAGGALALGGLDPQQRWRAVVLKGCACLILALGVLSLCEHGFGWNLGIDQLLYPQTSWPDPGSVPGRLAPVSAFNFTLLGLALLVFPRQRLAWIGQALASAVGVLGLLAVLGYAYDVQAFYQIGPFPPMALHTAIGFCLLALACLFARPEQGLMSLVSGHTYAGAMARRLLPAAILLPVVLGWLHRLGEAHGLYPAAFGAALFVLGMIIIFAAVVLASAHRLLLLEAARNRAQAEVQSLALFPEENPCPVLRVFHDGTILYANPGSAALLGFWGCQEPPCSVPEPVRQCVAQALKTNCARELEAAPDAKVYSLMVAPITAGGYANLYGRDVTARKRVEAALVAAQAQLRMITDTMAVGVTRCSRDLRYLWVSRSYARWLSRSPEEIAGRPIAEVIGPAAYAAIRPHIERVLTGQRVEYEAQVDFLGAGLVWIDALYTPTYDATGRPDGWVGVVTDITARKRAELELAATRDQLAVELRAMNLLHELGTRFLRQEELRSLLDGILGAAITITGASKGNVQLLDAASDELTISVQRGFGEEFVEFFSHIRPGEAACGTVLQTRQCVVVEDITRSPIFLAQPRALQLKLAAGVRAIICTPLLTRAGQLVGVLSVHFGAPHRPSERDLRLLDLLARQGADFIKHTKTEEALRQARDELARANKDLEQKVQDRTAQLQEMVGELEHFSYTITHDMRAPLRAMQGFGNLLVSECADCLQADRRDLLRRIAEAANRMDQLITDALNYSKIMRHQFDLLPVDAGTLLAGIVESYPQFQPPKAEVLIALNMPKVLANEAGLTQVCSNLLGNAVKFVEPGKTPQVRVWAESRGEWVRLWFQDNGIGIEKEYHDKIWEMFQQLSKGYEGTGIGLALVRKTVERMRGRVGVESEPGRGSRFWVELKRGD